MKYAIIIEKQNGTKNLFAKESKWSHNRMMTWLEGKFEDAKSITVRSLDRVSPDVRLSLLRNNFITLVDMYGDMFRNSTVIIKRNGTYAYKGKAIEVDRDLLDFDLKNITTQEENGKVLTVWEIV